jgi:transposase
MITPPAGARILLATRPVDFRKGAHSLATLAAEVLGADPFSGAVLVFRSRRADRVKILIWDGSGLVLIWKQLEANTFRWPPVVNGVLRLTAAQFAALSPCVMCGRPPRCKGFLDATAPRSGAVMCPASMCGAHDRGP